MEELRKRLLMSQDEARALKSDPLLRQAADDQDASPCLTIDVFAGLITGPPIRQPPRKKCTTAGTGFSYKD